MDDQEFANKLSGQLKSAVASLGKPAPPIDVNEIAIAGKSHRGQWRRTGTPLLAAVVVAVVVVGAVLAVRLWSPQQRDSASPAASSGRSSTTKPSDGFPALPGVTHVGASFPPALNTRAETVFKDLARGTRSWKFDNLNTLTGLSGITDIQAVDYQQRTRTLTIGFTAPAGSDGNTPCQYSFNVALATSTHGTVIAVAPHAGAWLVKNPGCPNTLMTHKIQFQLPTSIQLSEPIVELVHGSVLPVGTA